MKDFQDVLGKLDDWRRRFKPAAKFLNQIQRLVQILLDPRAAPWVKAIALAALAYVACPVDAIPDALPGGLADDLVVVAAALARIAKRFHSRGG